MPKCNHLIAANITSLQQSKALTRWIENLEFEQYESAEYVLQHEQSRPMNRLYKFMLTDINREVIMKVVYINRDNKWKKQLKSILRHYLRASNRKAFCCCERAYAHNLATPEPLAYWKKNESLTRFRTYFLYQYVESFSWPNTYRELKKIGDAEANQKSDLIIQKIINALKSLHRQGIRHGDVMSHNILMSMKDSDKLSNAKVYFVDYDNASFTKIKYPIFIKTFFDIKDLWKMRIDDNSPYDMLRFYLKDDYHPWWNIVLFFWRWRGLKEANISFPDKLKRLKQRLLRL